MVYRLPSERVAVQVADGPSVEVERLQAEHLQRAALRLYAAAITGRDADAIGTLYGFFLDEAQPTWEIADHRGLIAPTLEGMARIPVPLALGIVLGWIETFMQPDLPTAADEALPPGPLRDTVNAELRRKGTRRAE